MELYFNLKDDQFDTNLPEEMQIWLRNCIELTDEVLNLLKQILDVINKDEEWIKKFIAFSLMSLSMGKEDEYCCSPFDAAFNVLGNKIICLNTISEFEIGEYYAANSFLLDEYMDILAEETETEFDEGEIDLEAFGSWIIESESREIYFDYEKRLTYDFTLCEIDCSLDKVRNLLSRF